MELPSLLRRKQPQPKPRVVDDGQCKIKTKRTRSGEEITFSPGCTKQQIDMAKERLNKNAIETEEMKE